MLPCSSSSTYSKLPPLVCDRELGKLLRQGNNVSKQQATSSSTNTGVIFIMDEDLMEKAQDFRSRLESLKQYEVHGMSDLELFVKEWVRKVRVAFEDKLLQLMQQYKNGSKIDESAAKLTSSTSKDHSLEVDSLKEMVSKYERLSETERLYLPPFTLVPENASLTKRDVLHLTNDGYGNFNETEKEFDNIMPKLVEEGFISIIVTNHLSSKYSMPPTFRSWILNEDRKCRHKRCPGFDVITFENVYPYHAFISMTKLFIYNWDTCQGVFRELQDAKVVRLGNWKKQKQHADHYDNDYIVVDMYSLYLVLRTMDSVRYLCLRGTSGILHLPEWKCLPRSLQTLDLRACSNLESLTKEIGELHRLIYLDLSESYFLEHIPIQIANLSQLQVLKGFIINDMDLNERVNERTSHNSCIKWYTSKIKSPSPSCPFSALWQLKNLEKLTIRTRRINFPAEKDLNTLCQLTSLGILGITWVANPTSTAQLDDINLQGFLFPNKVEKLDIQRAPHRIASQLLELVGEQKDSKLKKIYITGGDLQELNPEKHRFANVEVVRVRYLHKFKMDWYLFKESFPSLVWLQVCDCPSLTPFRFLSRNWNMGSKE